MSIGDSIESINFSVYTDKVVKFLLFITVAGKVVLCLTVPSDFEGSSGVVGFVCSGDGACVLLFLVIFSVISFVRSVLCIFTLVVAFVLFFLICAVSVGHCGLSTVTSMVKLFGGRSIDWGSVLSRGGGVSSNYANRFRSNPFEI